MADMVVAEPNDVNELFLAIFLDRLRGVLADTTNRMEFLVGRMHGKYSPLLYL